MELLWFAITKDWAVLMPIVLCSVLVMAVTIERWNFYRRNRRDVLEFINRMDRDLQRNSLESALNISTEVGGLLGEVASEGIRILHEQRSSFERLFDITSNLATRKLERNLSVLGTVATVSPYLGLFGTVVRILLTFGEMSKGAVGAGGAQDIMFGIGSALIATAFGLAVAITSVALNNYFHTVVGRWEEDFQILKLLFMSVTEQRRPAAVPPTQPAYPRRTEI